MISPGASAAQASTLRLELSTDQVAEGIGLLREESGSGNPPAAGPLPKPQGPVTLSAGGH